MLLSNQQFYGHSALKTAYTREDVLDGHVVKINPALITITDGLVNSVPVDQLQRKIYEHVAYLRVHGVHTFHIDINFEDYRGYSQSRPDMNARVFTPDFLRDLNKCAQAAGAFLNLHLLTNFPQTRLREYATVGAGAICFQLDSVQKPERLVELVDYILDLGACASPVIETVGTEDIEPLPFETVQALLEPVLPRIGMLTFQAAATATRTMLRTGMLDRNALQSYLNALRRGFNGTVQIQGGITTHTVREAVRLGAEFLVCGTQIFRNREGQTPPSIIEAMLMEAAQALGNEMTTTIQ